MNLEQYFQNLFKTTKSGDATEESYYPDLKSLLESYSESKKANFHVTTLPKRTEAGNPDFRIWDGKSKIIGYIEAKAPTVIDLDQVEYSEQLKRYKNTFSNLILTNFFEFRLYRNGKLIKKTFIGRAFAIHTLKTVPPAINQDEFLKLLDQFFSFSIPKTTTAKALAVELAKRTRFLRDNVISEELKEESIEGIQILEGFFKAFKDHLIPSLDRQTFADLFAQTITYGLFAARSRADTDFTRELAYKFIPQTIGILRDVFRFISSTDLPERMEWIIDDITEVLAESDVQKIVHGFYKKGRGLDPIVHFYETFLSEYDPREREKRGVYYTPEPVVSYITRSIHKLLKEKFGKEDGFATSSVTVLDPAAGTLTFPAEAIRLAIEEYKKKYGDGGIKRLIKDHLLENFYGFELMMAPYAMGHLKMGFILDELGYQLGNNERFQLFLTNTLEFQEIEQLEAEYPGLQSLAKESKLAGEVKREIPIMVIFGNPPYSGMSENKGEWILEQIKEYKRVDGQPLGERNPKWLQDDYVKFFRFAQWKIQQSGKGILGFITNHAWLDNPTFRGMRASLLNTFDEIYILNLHGSTLKKEQTPEGGKDENIFDIQPGVAITIGIKNEELQKRVLYSDVWGFREKKYEWLFKNDVKSTKWSQLNPTRPYYFAVPKQDEGWEKYKYFWKITDIFSINSVGIVTGRDEFVIDDNLPTLKVRIRNFVDSKDGEEYLAVGTQLKDKPASGWYIKNTKEKLKKEANLDKYFTKIFYRPFDEKWIFYHPALIERNRENVMRHLIGGNLSLVVCRQSSGDNFYHVLVADGLVESSYVSNKTKEIGYVFPFWISGSSNHEEELFKKNDSDIKSTNLSSVFIKFWGELGDDFDTGAQYEDFFYYIYAILHSNIYRERYKEFLKIDFPRIPFTKDYKLFQKLTDLGERLVNLHLLKAVPANHRHATQFVGQASDKVEKLEWRSNELWINNNQRFTPVSKKAWEYYIGGYQVLNKWLKDRKGKYLSSENIKHYCKMVTAIDATTEIQKEIDKLYEKIELV